MIDTTTHVPVTGKSTVPIGLAAGSFGSILSEELHWISFPAYPPQVRLAMLVGNPQAADAGAGNASASSIILMLNLQVGFN